MDIADRISCGSVHWDTGPHLSPYTVQCYSFAAEKIFLLKLRIIIPLGDVSILSSPFYMTSLFLNYEVSSFSSEENLPDVPTHYWLQFRLWEGSRMVAAELS